MKDLRIEVTDDGGGLYLALDPDGLWAKTTRPDNFITIDWDRQGRVIGIELLGSAASTAVKALVDALIDFPATDPESVREAVAGLARSEVASS